MYAGPQPLFPADPNYISRFELIQTPYFTWTYFIEFDSAHVKYGVWTAP